MKATQDTSELTALDIERAYDDERYLGWGYLNGRNDLSPSIRSAADGTVLDYANRNGWNYEALFAWMNSRPGRWFADDPTHPKAHTCLHRIDQGD